MKKNKFIIITVIIILLALPFLRLFYSFSIKFPENVKIDVWLQVNSNTHLLISDDNTYCLKEILNKRIRIPKLFEEKTMLTEGDYIIDIYQNEKKIHSYRMHDEKKIYDRVNDSLYMCDCLDELRNILIQYFFNNYLVKMDFNLDNL